MKRLVGLLGVSLICGLAFGQEEPVDSEPMIEWQEGPVTGRLSTISTLDVPEGYVFADADNTKVFMEYQGNLISDTEIGTLAPISNSWFAVFKFDAIGYVKDDEKDSLDADGILQSMRNDQLAANEQRRAMQMGELEIDGWYRPPFYNEETHNLEWCTQIHEIGEDIPFVNHNIRILGRHGVTKVILVADFEELDEAISELSTILDGYAYNVGSSYAEYRKGDKIAKYGLTALVAGGAAAVALKSGLLTKLWKPIAALFIGIGAFFKKLFGKKDPQQ